MSNSSAALSPAATLVDPDNTTNEQSVTVHITGGTFSGDGDVLSVNNQLGISASYNSSTETLVLTWPASPGNFTTVLDQVKFSSTSSHATNFGSNPTRTLTWQANDGISLSALATTTLTIVKAPPSFSSLAASANFTENGASVTLSGVPSPALAVGTVLDLAGQRAVVASVMRPPQVDPTLR